MATWAHMRDRAGSARILGASLASPVGFRTAAVGLGRSAQIDEFCLEVPLPPALLSLSGFATRRGWRWRAIRASIGAGGNDQTLCPGIIANAAVATCSRVLLPLASRAVIGSGEGSDRWLTRPLQRSPVELDGRARPEVYHSMITALAATGHVVTSVDRARSHLRRLRDHDVPLLVCLSSPGDGDLRAVAKWLGVRPRDGLSLVAVPDLPGSVGRVFLAAVSVFFCVFS